ncbi:MAG: M48 family metallopeptidase [Clostridiaceae bacterium]|nr:M48 family metallopeptidase [Clostridiaceae bacterium]
MSCIKIDGIEIEVIRKNIKNMHLYVLPPDGRVRITAPVKLKDAAIRIFATSKLDWIKKHRAKYLAQKMQPEKRFESGEIHYYQGKGYILNVLHTNSKQRVEVCKEKNRINLFVREGSTMEQRKKVLTEWYRSKLKEQIPGIIEKWEKIMGVKVKSFGVKLMKTRWGTCNINTGRIWINLELAKRSDRCLEYIVVHEMTHLIEKYHNKRFYSYMNMFMPDWKEIRQELKNSSIAIQ